MAIIPCTYCGDNRAIIMDINLGDGETASPCAVCIVPHAMNMAAAVTQGMTKEAGEAYGALFDAIAANDPRPPKPPARGGKRKAAAEPVPDVAPDGSQPLAEGQIALPPGSCPCGSATATGDAEKLVCDGCGSVLATSDDAAV